jgi:hypothetical protein
MDGALLIAGVQVAVIAFAREPEERGGGGLRRTLNGQLRGRTDWAKRAWSADLVAADAAALAVLLDLTNPDIERAVSGYLLENSTWGATVNCRITRGDVVTIRARASADRYYTLPVTIREV